MPGDVRAILTNFSFHPFSICGRGWGRTHAMQISPLTIARPFEPGAPPANASLQGFEEEVAEAKLSDGGQGHTASAARISGVRSPAPLCYPTVLRIRNMTMTCHCASSFRPFCVDVLLSGPSLASPGPPRHLSEPAPQRVAAFHTSDAAMPQCRFGRFGLILMPDR